jgi:streptogramin lyase
VLGVLWAGVSIGAHRGGGQRGGGAAIQPAPPAPAAGRIVASIALPGPAGALAVGDGAVWVSDDRDGTLLRVDPGSERVVATVALGSPEHDTVTGIAVLPGSVWLAIYGERALVRVDTGTNRVAGRIPLGVTPSSLTLDGTTAWVASSQGDRVLRVDLAAQRVAATVSTPSPASVAAGGGIVWVGSRSDGVVSRIDPATNRIARVLTPQAALDYVVESLAAAPDGSLWFRNLDAQTVEHLDPRTGTVVVRAPVYGAPALPASDPFDVAATDQAVWLANATGLVRIDAGSFARSVLALVGPDSIAIGPDGIWAGTTQAQLVHVQPAS